MALEDFRTYTEVDDDGDITVTQTKCDVSTMRRDAVSYVYKDMGVGHFGEFEHKFTIHIGTADIFGVCGFWGLSNGAYTEQDKRDDNEGLMFKLYERAVGVESLELNEWPAFSSDLYDGDANTTYYITIERAGLVLTAKIYSDAARTLLLDTLTVACVATAYRYIQTISSRESAANAGASGTGYVENLDLQEGYPHSFASVF